MKNLYTIILLALFGLSKNANAQAPNWQWAKSAGGTSSDAGGSVSTDASGNVYVTGLFSTPSITFGTTTLTSANNTGTTSDIFLAKYDASGNVIWAKSAGGTSNDAGESLSIDVSGNVYVTGRFSSPSIIFGANTLTNADNTGYTYDIFFAKYDASGNILWAKSVGGTSDDDGSVSTDASGNVYVAGGFKSPSITFGTSTLTNANNTGTNSDIFLAKYDASGNVLWAKSAGGTSDDDGNSVSTDASGNVYITGGFNSPSITFGTSTLTNAGGYDIFLAKYDASGNILWVKSAGGTDYDYGVSVSTDVSGNVYVTGGFYSPSITFGTSTLTNAGNYYDFFLAKYDASGNVLWAKSAGGTFTDIGQSVSTDASGNVYVTGYFNSSSISFGTITLSNTGGTGNTFDIFLVKYDASGNVLWAKNTGGTFSDYVNSVSTDASGNVYVTGSFYSPSITFGASTLTNADNTGSTNDFFLAKINNGIGIAEENNNSSGITIYPNPFSTQTVLQSDRILENATLTIYNCFGQAVKEIKNISGQTVTFSRDNLASGLYFVRLTEENKIISVDKLVITDK